MTCEKDEKIWDGRMKMLSPPEKKVSRNAVLEKSIADQMEIRHGTDSPDGKMRV